MGIGKIPQQLKIMRTPHHKEVQTPYVRNPAKTKNKNIGGVLSALSAHASQQSTGTACFYKEDWEQWVNLPLPELLSTDISNFLPSTSSRSAQHHSSSDIEESVKQLASLSDYEILSQPLVKVDQEHLNELTLQDSHKFLDESESRTPFLISKEFPNGILRLVQPYEYSFRDLNKYQDISLEFCTSASMSKNKCVKEWLGEKAKISQVPSKKEIRNKQKAESNRNAQAIFRKKRKEKMKEFDLLSLSEKEKILAGFKKTFIPKKYEPSLDKDINKKQRKRDAGYKVQKKYQYIIMRLELRKKENTLQI